MHGDRDEYVELLESRVEKYFELWLDAECSRSQLQGRVNELEKHVSFLQRQVEGGNDEVHSG